MEEIFNYTDEKLHNLDKNILIDTLKHTSDIMTALSSKVHFMEEEIKNIQEQLLSLSKLILDKSINPEKESSINPKKESSINNFDKLYKTNQNIDIIYDNENNNNLNNIKQETKDIIKKEETPGNIINNRKKNNLFIRNI
jgi:hypothetical protein